MDSTGVHSLNAHTMAASILYKSQAHAGWTLILSRNITTGGYSVGPPNRPTCRLLGRIRSRKLDCHCRPTGRSPTTIPSRICQARGTVRRARRPFVSVTQQFNTTTSIGPSLTLNVLLPSPSLRGRSLPSVIRDKIAASKRKGVWVGGPLPSVIQ